MNTVKCKECGHPVSSQQKFCSECGSKVQASWFTEQLSSDLDLYQGFIEDGSTNGQPLDGVAEYCPYCGSRSIQQFSIPFNGLFSFEIILFCGFTYFIIYAILMRIVNSKYPQ
jgi:RNA polymerase subunit RPABC4/transcription elongation factor Spt4